jgi:hypothetical protein
MEQVAWLCQNLRDGGLVILLEKCSLADNNEYTRREVLKAEFKANYFRPDQIEAKEREILGQMERGQVSLEELADGISANLKHVVVTWNSGNFYTIIASNDPMAIQEFVGRLLPPCMPPQLQPRFQHIDLPKILRGPHIDLSFRRPLR